MVYLVQVGLRREDVMVESGDDCTLEESNGKDTTTGMSAWDKGKIVQHVVVGAIGDGWFGGGRDDGFF